MEIEKHEAKLFNLNRSCEVEGEVIIKENSANDEIILQIIFENTLITAASDSYLSAYQELRDKLLKLGLGLKCNGSCINAVQSAMMSYSSKIYLVEIGKQASLKSIVDIWGYCDINIFPDTEKQKEFTEAWFESIEP